MDLSRLERPVFLIDRAKVLRNLERMAGKAGRSRVSLRPHVKTHQSAAVAAWLRDFGVTAIAVSSVDMAAYFVSAGWTDVLVAVPVNVHQIEEINELAARADLQVTVESAVTAERLAAAAASTLGVWIEMDTGYHRTGIDVARTDLMLEVAAVLARNPRLRLKGLLCHDGHTYAASRPDEVRTIHEASVAALGRALAALEAGGFKGLGLSIGDTPACSIVETFLPPVTEIRPGNFIFYDLVQASLGACREEEIAAAVAGPVIAKHPERGEIVLYGGGVHISKESLRTGSGETVFGAIGRIGIGGAWTAPVPDVTVSSLSQEHGKIKAPPEFVSSVKIGDGLAVFPVHACLTANLHRRYYVLGEGWISNIYT